MNPGVSHRNRLAYRASWGVLIIIMIGLTSGLHEFARAVDSDARRLRAAVEYSELIASMVLSDLDRTTDRLQQTCERLVEQPALMGMCVTNSAGEVLASSSDMSLLLPLLNAPLKYTGADIPHEQFTPPESIAGNLSPLERIKIHLSDDKTLTRPGELFLLIAPDVLAPKPGGHVMKFYLPLFASGLFVWLLGKLWLRNGLEEPMKQLEEVVGKVRTDPKNDEICHRLDAWGAAARCIMELREEVEEWQEQNRKTERRMDLQIAEETQRITRHLKKIERESSIDHMTGLNNRRSLDGRMPVIFNAQQSIRGDLTAIMFDLDHFKSLNDTFGHAAGDQVLEFAGELLHQCSRAEDLAVRYGGDEFLLILPGIAAYEGLVMAQRLIAMFTQRVKMLFPQAGVSMTAGIASLAQHKPTTSTELIVMADRALYQAKRAGKHGARILGRTSRQNMRNAPDSAAKSTLETPSL